MFLFIPYLGINLAGVKWVIRLQFGLLIILLLAALDLAVGTFVQVDLGIYFFKNSFLFGISLNFVFKYPSSRF